MPAAVARLLLALVLVLAAGAATAHAQGTSADGEPQEGIWISRAELAQLPTSGPAWSRLSARADEELGEADIADQDTEHDVTTFAAALVSARTGSGRLRQKAATGIMNAIGTEEGGRTLALSRALMSYVLAADLIDLRGLDADKDRVFRRWLRKVRTERLEPRARPTLVATLLPGGRSISVGPLAEAVDPEVERARLQDDLRKAESEHDRAERKLADARFVERAPAHLVEAEREKADRYAAEREALAARIAALG